MRKARTPPKLSAVTPDRKSTRLNSSHLVISYAVFCLKKKKNTHAPLVPVHYGLAARPANLQPHLATLIFPPCRLLCLRAPGRPLTLAAATRILRCTVT